MKSFLLVVMILLGGCSSLRPYCSSRLVPINSPEKVQELAHQGMRGE